MEHFIKRFNLEQRKNVQKVSPEAMKHLIGYSWNGNIRQLENEIEKIITLVSSELTTITPDLLSEEIRELKDRDIIEQERGLKQAVESLEKQMIREALEKFNGNKTKAAQYLGVSRRGFHKMLNRLGLTTA